MAGHRAGIRLVAPGEIEAESFRIIEDELGQTHWSPGQFAVVRRMIHATGDFDFSRQCRFHPLAIDAALDAIRAGRNILVDVHMAESGISAALLGRFGGQVVCRLAEEQTARLAAEKGWTRSEAAMVRACDDNVGIVAIGNAPTALLRVLELMDEGRLRPDCVIGVPVGFVNAAESKELLAQRAEPFITVLGRKGGTPVAVAAVNALLRLV